MTLKTLNAQWQQFQIVHPALAHLVVDHRVRGRGRGGGRGHERRRVQRAGIQRAATIIGTAVVMAIRNYLKTNSANLKLKLDAQKGQAE